MKTTYLACVTQDAATGWYDIAYPDLPGAHSQAHTLAEVQPQAADVLAEFLYAAEQVGMAVAAPSASINVPDGSMAVIVTVDMDQYRMMQDTRPVKKTVSLPAWMATSADKAGLSLSKVLQDSLRARLNQ